MARHGQWIVEPKSKLRKRGSRLRTAAANNTLVKASWLRRHFPELRFDEDFRFSGGEDTDFFFQVADRGGRIVWVDDAIVTEQISSRRASLTYQLVLACRTAENAFRIHKKRKSYAAAVWRYLPKAIGRLARGSSLVVGAGAWWLVDRRYAARLSFLGGKAVSVVECFETVRGAM